MNSSKKIQKHPSILYANDIVDICRPLEKLNINYFAHMHIDNDNNLTGHCNNAKFLEHYLSKKQYDADINMASAADLGNYVLWDEIELFGETMDTNQEAIEHGVDHTFTIIETDETGSHYYNFASNLIGKSINHEYLRNYDLLKVFIQYFRDTVNQSKALKKAYNIKFSPSKHATGFEFEKPTHCVDSSNRGEFINEIQSKSPHLLNLAGSAIEDTASTAAKLTNLKLTTRQYQCLILYIQGKTSKEISSQLNLSRRTVENYLYQVKSKLNVSTRAELTLKIMPLLKNLQLK